MNERQCLRVAFGMENDTTLIDSHYGDSNFFAIYEISDLLPTLKGEGSNELTPHRGRGGLRGFTKAQ